MDRICLPVVVLDLSLELRDTVQQILLLAPEPYVLVRIVYRRMVRELYQSYPLCQYSTASVTHFLDTP